MKAQFAALAFASTLILSSAVSAQTDGGTPPDETPPAAEGAFEALSPGNRKIVNAIHESQFGSPNETDGGTLLSRDEIAAMKAGTGWGKLYKELYRQGYTTERNLGQAVSKYNHQPSPLPETGVVITTATGAKYSAGGGRGGRAGGARGPRAKDSTAPGSAAGLTGGAGNRGGRALGHGGRTVVTSGDGGMPGGGRTLGHGYQTVITSGAGAAITAGPATHSSAGGKGLGRGGAKKVK